MSSLREDILAIQDKIEKEKILIERQRTKKQMELIGIRAKKFLNKKVVLYIEFEGYEDKGGNVEGYVSFVGNTSLILDNDGKSKTWTDRKVWNFRDIVSIRLKNKMEVN